MSNLILPGDPPADDLKRQIGTLGMELSKQRAMCNHLIQTLIETVSQHGENNMLHLGPPTKTGKKCYVRYYPDEHGGVDIKLTEELTEGNGEEAK